MNQITMIGPNIPPIHDVPLRYTRNRVTRITSVRGTTARSSLLSLDKGEIATVTVFMQPLAQRLFAGFTLPAVREA
jgi:hypothetical protein